MRKDVKRSLILWPGMATAIVALISGYSIMRDISQCIGPDTESLVIATLPRFDFTTPKMTNVEPSSRGEYGRRAMDLPERVASVLGVSSDEVTNVDAPKVTSTQYPGSHRSRHNRIAGMILPPWGVVIDTSGNSDTSGNKESSTPTTKNPVDVSQMLSDIIELNPPASVLPNSNRALAKPHFAKLETDRPANDIGELNDVDAMDLDSARLAQSKTSSENRDTTYHVTGWPATNLLDSQLADLSAAVVNASNSGTPNSEIARWIAEVTVALQELRSLSRIGDEDAERLIELLRRLAIDGQTEAEKIGERSIQVRWLATSHAISRRVAIWKPVWRLANTNSEPATQSRFAIAMKPDAFGSVHAAIDRVRSILPESGDASGWDTYLLLERIDNAASSGDKDEREAVAKQFASRLKRRSLHPAHRKWLERDSIHELRRAVGPWARGVVDYADLLSQIERQEASNNENATNHIVDTMQTLRVADIQDANQLAESIDTYYRNANIRIAISQLMLQRLVPEVPAQSVPVRTRMQGSRIRGQSQISSELKVQLVPSVDRWNMHLQTIGQVQTRATGVRGPVSVRTDAKSEFTATTPIQINAYGVSIGDSTADVSGRTRLRGIQTDYDNWPVIGSLVRSAAARKFDSMSSQSSKLSNRKIATEIESKVDTEFHQRVGEATEHLAVSLLGPLGRLNLDPTVTDMKTTKDRLVARYRLAGNGQLAAHTPRPRAFGNSLASVQVHQSAINNTLANLVPTNELTSIRDAIAGAMATFGDRDVAIPEDIPSDVTVQFSRNQPIMAEFKDNAMWLTLRVVRLRRGDRLNLTKFIVQAEYRPHVEGMQASLAREGHLRISGPGMSMRERLPIRAIFNKVLASSRPLPLTVPAMVEHRAMDNLQIQQLDLRDGWIAMAIAEASPDRVATAGTNVE